MIDALVEEYYSKYDIILEGRDPEEFKRHVAVQAQIEIGFEKFLEEKNYQAIVTHFGDLGALQQLPGLAIQRLMEKGYGFGAEGDWKTAAMVRLMKDHDSRNERCKRNFLDGRLYIQPGTWKRRNPCSLICWRFARLLQMARSASKFARFPWVTEKILQDLYSQARQVRLSQHP